MCSIFFGKTKVMAKALGSNESSEHLPGLSQLSPHMSGDVGLLFSPRAPADVLEYFDTYTESDFARAGVPAQFTFTVPEGVVYATGGVVAKEEDVPVPHSIETTLRKWGMPTRLDKGKIILDGPYTVCKEGKSLDSNQTALLKMFGVEMAQFQVKVVAYWTGATGKVTAVESGNDAMEES
jgi:mRNA turnover protein 4